MVVVGGAIPAAPPDGTVQPGLGRGTSLGVGGQTIGTFYPKTGKAPPGSRPGPSSSVGFGTARLVSPARSLPRAPRAARMPRRPCAPLLPSCVGWAGTAAGLPARRAAVGRAGVRRPGSVRGGGGACGPGFWCWCPGPCSPAAPPAPAGLSATVVAGWVGRRPRTCRAGESSLLGAGLPLS